MVMAEQNKNSDFPQNPCEIYTPISPGELFDKLTIPEIKSAFIDTPFKLAHVRYEYTKLLEQFQTILDPRVKGSSEVLRLRDALKDVNTDLWNVEDAIRECEHEKNFGEQFIALARSVYRLNERRSEIKREINILFGSRIIEEKSYKEYQ
jgi:predicted nuclease with TOPRIM domain